MATTIITKNGSGAPLAGDLTAGELAVDLTNKRLYSKDSGGNVIEIGSGSSTVSDLTVSGDLTVDTNTLVVDSTNNRVGIGISAPEAELHIYDSTPILKMEHTGNNSSRFYFESTTDGAWGGFSANNESGNRRIMFTPNNGTADARYGGLTLYTDKAEIGGVFDTDYGLHVYGNVGIGTASPSSQLNVEGSSTTVSIDLNASDSTIQGRLYSDDSGQTLLYADRLGNAVSPALRFYTGTSERMRIDSSGRVGIGDSSPDAGLTVHNNAGAVIANSNIARQTYTSVGQLQVSTSAGGGILVHTEDNTASGFLGFGDGAVAGRIEYAHSSDRMTFMTGSNTRMTLDASGNLLVGVTSYGTVANLGCQLGQNGVGIFHSNNDIPMYINRTTSGVSTSQIIVSFYRNSVQSGSINVAQSGTPAFAAPSDLRLKDNVTDHESELANVMSLRPVRWNWKDKNRGEGEGFVAQELEQTAWADLVSEGDDGYKTVAGLGAVETRLIKALQEAVTRIETLEAEVAALKGAN